MNIDIKDTINRHAFIFQQLDLLLNLASYQYTDMVTFDDDRDVFEVVVVSETMDGTDYDDVEVTLERLVQYIKEHEHEHEYNTTILPFSS